VATRQPHCSRSWGDWERYQRDLDVFLDYYNLRRSHQGYRLNGKTPAQALREALGIDDLPPLFTAVEKEDLNAEEQPAA